MSSRAASAHPNHALRRFLVTSVSLGLVVAAMALPIIGTGAIAARNAARDFESLPSVLDAPPPAARSVLLSTDGTVIGQIAYENRVQVSLDQIAVPMRAAIVAVEDARFYQHGGVDLRGTLRALARNSSSGSVEEGGSTLTQQYVKNVLLEDASTDSERDAARARTLTRKLQEARYAITLESRLTKDEILERYLDIAYFGSGAYGVEAAATHYFGVHASELTLAQAATLAGIVQNPTGYDPTVNPRDSQARRDVVLTRMQDEGLATAAEVAKAKATPIEDELDVQTFKAGCISSVAPYFCDYVLSVMKTDKAFGRTAADRLALLRRGGLTVRTTLDLDLQRSAQQTVDAAIPRKDPSHKATAVVTVQPGTGQIRAMAQNTTYGTKGRQTTVNYSVDAKHNGWSDGVQPGSTFKAFTIAAALDKGVSLDTSISTHSGQTYSGFTDCAGRSLPSYSPSSDKDGTQSMASAAAYSVNGYFVALEKDAGVCATAKMIDKLGVREADGTKVPRVPSLTLGTATTTPLDMASAYATFAADGRYCAPTAITGVTDRDGSSLDVPPEDCGQPITPAVAQATTQILTNVIDGPYPGRTGAKMSLGRPAAGKTGTTDDNAAVWFVGYTPQLATAVWVGDPRGSSKHPLKNVTINGRYYSQLYGGTFAGPIWHAVMKAALAGTPKTAFTRPDPGGGVNGVRTTVPAVANLDSGDALRQLERLGLVGDIDPTARASSLPAGTVLSSYPAAGAHVRSGDTVRLVVSSGVPPYTPPPVTVAPQPSTSVVPSIGTTTAAP